MTPIKLSELELHAEAVKKTEWCDCGDDPRNQNRLTGEVNHAQSCKNRRSNAYTISRLCEALRIAVEALESNEMTDELYKEFQTKRQPYSCTNWDVKDLIKIKDAILKIKSLVDLS